MSVVTFLFTDIEGSTRRWEADADAMQVALENHNRVLREALEAHDGHVFNYTGDGMCAVFTSPRSAVDAAITAQLALELPVRMGICTGEAELRGEDYSGTVLNRTARVMAAGHGGQVLLDGSTAGLLSEVELISLGPRRLRDIAKPVELFQVQSAGLRTEFPPLRTADPTRGNLRIRNTTFIGREVELAELEQVLKTHQLVTLTGVGGVGKTRLALEVAGRLADNFLDGVWVIELASVGDPTAVPEAVAAVLGIVQQPGSSLTDSIAATLEGRSRLLVLDNCEHLLDATADLVEAILAASSTVKVVATSREGLRVANEQLWPVPSLDVRTSAVDLFIERAHDVAPRISVIDDVGAVTEICRRLDGIPLAIELAASRMQSMTAIELRDRLDDRFRLLVGSRRGLERHQTLRHAVQWSYDLLDTAEMALLNRCSVFAGGFELAGAAAVDGSSDDLATLDLLDALVRKSLLIADRSSVHTRFSMLETIRQFAEEQLVCSGEADATRAEHARYFAAREDDVLALWDGPRQREAYAWFTSELANLRVAFRWAADHDDLDTAAAIAICSALMGFFVPQYEPFAWAEELLEPAETIEHRRLAQLYVMAAFCHAAGRIADFIRYSQAARLAIDSGRYDDVPDFFEGILAGGYVTAGQPERCIEWARNAIARKPSNSTSSKLSLAIALNFTGSCDEAVAVADEVLTNARGNTALECFALVARGLAYRDSDPAKAYDALGQALTKARDSANTQIESNVAGTLSALAATQGDSKVAFEYFTFSIRHFADSGSPTFMRTPLAALAVFFDRLGHHESAATIIEAAATPLARAAYPEIDDTIAHLRDVLGNDSYESLTLAGQSMTNPELSDYALDQIDRARARLLHGDGSP
jgi:predicted ATPase